MCFHIIKYAKKRWQQVFPNDPFNYFFLQDQNKKQYKDLNLLMIFLGTAGVVLVILSGFGIYGFTYFETKRRTKELAIRKVYNASNMDLVSLLFKEFIAIYSVALIVAVPVIYYIISKWFNNFVIHFKVTFMMMLYPILLISLIYILILFERIFKITRTSPIESIQDE